MSFYASPALPWTVSEEDEQRFRTIQRRLLIFFLITSVIWPFLPTPRVERAPAELPPRFAKLLLERQAPPPPPPVAKAPEPEAVRPETAPVPKTSKPEKIEKAEPKKDVEIARRRAERAGLLAMKDELADLRDNPVAEKLSKSAKPGPGVGTGTGPGVGSSSGPALGAGARAIITGNVARGSGGVTTSHLSSGFGGGGLAGRSTTQVNSPVGGGSGGGGSVQRGGAGLARSIEEIKLVFDKNKSAIYVIYNRALREDPGLQGKVVLKLTIAPSGVVTGCEVVSSELRSPDLERKLVARIKQFDFGAKAVNVMVVTYPIDFLPS